METPNDIDVLFVAGFDPIVRDPAASRKFYSVTSVPRWLFRYSLRQIRSRLVAREDYRAIAPCQSRTQPPVPTATGQSASRHPARQYADSHWYLL
jgi:hypothetical protein